MTKKASTMKKIIHVNQHVIKRNRDHGENAPPLICRTYKGSQPAHEIEILGPAKIVHSPHKPLSCGARVWIETRADVRVLLDGDDVTDNEEPIALSAQLEALARLLEEALPVLNAKDNPKETKALGKRISSALTTVRQIPAGETPTCATELLLSAKSSKKSGAPAH